MPSVPPRQDSKPEKLSRGQRRILSYLVLYESEFEKAPFWWEIAHDLDIHQGMVATILSRLRKRKFLDYTTGARSIRLTDAGRQEATFELKRPRRWDASE